jgi:TonB family protein
MESKQELVAVPVARSTAHATETQLKQRRQMLIALGILLLALILVLLKDWNFWFQAAPANPSTAELERSVVTPEPPAIDTRTMEKSGASLKDKVAHEVGPVAAPSAPGIVASDRAALPPLEVEVVAGRHRQPVRSASNSVRVDMQSESVAQDMSAPVSSSAVNPAPVVAASETMHLSTDASQVVTRSVEPSYPMLAKQMKVQGAVVLQALIDRSGNIEDLRVLSGPSILSSAAMQAVKQWRFRPYYMGGEPVETQARITVNFTISTN